METGARREAIVPITGTGQVDAADVSLADLAADYGAAPASRRGVVAQWLSLARWQTLALPLGPVLATLCLLWSSGAKLQPMPAISTALAAALVFLGANMLDEYLEFERASASDWFAADDGRYFAGHALADSDVRPLSALRGSLALLAAGALAGIPAVVAGGAPVLGLGAAGIVIAILYSATGFALKRLPASELILAAALGPGLACATVLAERQRLSWQGALPGIALGLFALCFFQALHLRDRSADTAAGRRTLVTLLAAWEARTLYTLALLAAFAIAVYLARANDAWLGALAAVLAVPGAAVALTGTLRARATAAHQLAARHTLRADTTFTLLLPLGLLAGGAIIRLLALR